MHLLRKSTFAGLGLLALLFPCLPALSAEFNGSLVLGRPTGSSITASVLSADPLAIYLEYGTSSGVYPARTPECSLQANQPLEQELGSLSPNTRYYYRLRFHQASAAVFEAGEEYAFTTQRAPGSTFTFCVQGDSHPERLKTQFDPALYTRTLLTAAADRPDFYLTIGDDFSVDTLDPKTVTKALVTERYTIQRPFLGLIGRSAPVFLVNGNHEQAARYLLNGAPDNVAVWAQTARNAYYPQPAPDGFYTGNMEQVPYIGYLRNHYAWTWGDALFVTIDPYWSSPTCVDDPFGGGAKRSNLWEITHGDAQYQWLKATLEQSQAKYKFVFAHHVLGTQRGGIELAGQYEWGGLNGNGTNGFGTNRPTWPLPLHQLMAKNHVTVFFQGHDHIWVRQQLDGVIYQTLPEPADPNYALYNADAFTSGDKYPNTGYTRVTVSPAWVKVDYVRTYLPADESPTKVSGSVAFSYMVQEGTNTSTTPETPPLSSSGTSQLVNSSVRSTAGSGDKALILGFVISGTASKKLLIRAVGPTLSSFGVGNVLSDPTLSVYQAGTRLSTNDNWSGSSTAAEISAATTSVGAFPLPAGSKDAALLLTLAPGAYTALAGSTDGAEGVALVEVYEVP